MRPPPAWVRRAIIDPIWLMLGSTLALLCVAAAAIAILAAPLSRRRRPARLALFAALYLAIDVSLVGACAALSLRFPRPARRNPARWTKAHLQLLRLALTALVSAARPLLGFSVDVQEPPDRDLIAGRPLLVLARHGGPGDSFALVQLLMSRYQRCPAIVLKEALRWDPGLDVILGRLPSCFVRRGDGARMAVRLTELASSMHGDDAILLFPEGCNWTPRRHSRTIARLRRAGRRQAAADAASNPNVLPPRASGVLACMRARSDLDVAVVAHTGLEDLVSPATVWRALPVTGRPMTVRWWYEPAVTLPDSDDGRREWLRLHWTIVDSWIDARKAARSSPDRASLARQA
jgi:1-acyl-sn-glycerol-3-phosphate acyltransferase